MDWGALFDGRKHQALVASVSAMPHDDESRFVRVWFDSSPTAKALRPKHRTTQLAISVSDFLDRAARKPFRSYADVVAHARSASP